MGIPRQADEENQLEYSLHPTLYFSYLEPKQTSIQIRNNE